MTVCANAFSLFELILVLDILAGEISIFLNFATLCRLSFKRLQGGELLANDASATGGGRFALSAVSPILLIANIPAYCQGVHGAPTPIFQATIPTGSPLLGNPRCASCRRGSKAPSLGTVLFRGRLPQCQKH